MHVDAYVVETLMPDLVGHDRKPSAFLVYLYLWTACAAADGDRVEVSLRELGERTGLSKRAVQDAVQWLTKRRLLSVERESITAVARYRIHRPWRARRIDRPAAG